MRIHNLRMIHFRNYDTAELEFHNDVNIIGGANGTGKTSILEAIHYLCLSRSFKTVEDRVALNWNATAFDLEGTFIVDDSSLDTGTIRSHVKISYNGTAGKVVYRDHKKVERFSQMIGAYPVVISAPEDVAIVNGAPVDRRRFLDIALSQLYPAYLRDLQDYRKIVRQRNTLLNTEPFQDDTLYSWDSTLIATGTRITAQRIRFVQSFAPLVERMYHQISGKQETVRLLYRSSIDGYGPFEAVTETNRSEESLATAFREALKKNRSREILRKTTLVGPHKDDLLLMMNNKLLRDYGSQGQYKTLAVAVKIAEYLFLLAYKDQKPILLLDDVFSELDESRRAALMESFSETGQVFLTTAQTEPNITLSRPVKYFHVAANGIEARMN